MLIPVYILYWATEERFNSGLHVNKKARRFSLASHPPPSFILSSLILSHPVILSRSVSFSSRNLLPLRPVLLIEHAALRSRDHEAEGDPVCSAAGVEQDDDATNTVVEAVGEETEVIEKSVAVAAGDDVPLSAAFTVSQVGLGKCGLS